MATTVSKPTDYFGENLAKLLAGKIKQVYPDFDGKKFIRDCKRKCGPLSLTQRVELLADLLKQELPASYPLSINILLNIMGPENAHETGMFKEYYWLMPVGKFIEKYGLAEYEVSIRAIDALTRRNTGEYAIRPFIKKYPEATVKIMKAWAGDENFHLRRLASEGLRPKLPWAQKLDLFIDDPKPVFQILTMLQKEPVKFVQKSVANNLTDYLKVNPEPTHALLDKWRKVKNPNTEWMVWYATRKL